MTLKTSGTERRDTERVEHGTIKYGHETWINRLSTPSMNVACAEGKIYVSQAANSQSSSASTL